MRFALPLGLVLSLLVPSAALAAQGDPLPPKDVSWSFEGPFGTYDRGALQRGFQVYKEVCSACHSLDRVAFHALSEPGGPGFTDAQMKAIAASYKIPAGPNDKGDTVDDKGNRSVLPGTYHLSLGSTQPGETIAKSEVDFTVTGTVGLPK